MNENQNYPKWIDEYAKSVHNAFVHMVPSNWGPINYLDFFQALDGTFISKIGEAVNNNTPAIILNLLG